MRVEPIVTVADLEADLRRPDNLRARPRCRNTLPRPRETPPRSHCQEAALCEVRGKEYWILDLESKSIEIYVLKDGSLDSWATLGPNDIIRSTILADFAQPVSAVFSV
jgi:hypothetical protein